MPANGAQAVFDLRPMNLADMLDAVIRLYRHNFGVLVRIAAVIHIPLGVIQIASAAAAVGGIDPASPPTDIPMMTLLGGAGYALYFLLFLLATPIMQGAMAKAVAEEYLGAKTSVGDAYRFALRRWASLLWATILYGLTALGVAAVPLLPAIVLIGGSVFMNDGGSPQFGIAGVLAGIIGMLVAMAASVWVTIKLIFGPLVVVLEDETAPRALRRSWDLTNEHFMRVAATLFVVGLLTGVLTYMVAVPTQVAGALLQLASPAGGQAVAGAGTVIAQLFLQPIQIVASVLVYYDLRMRKEGFDLVMMAEAIGEPQLAARTPAGVARPAALYGIETPPSPPDVTMPPRVAWEPTDDEPSPTSPPAPPSPEPRRPAEPPPNGGSYEQ